jgi:membrane protease YdiL (CAAX protease family)
LAGIHREHAGRDAGLTYLVVAVLVTILMRFVHITIPVLGPLAPAAVAMLFLYAPMRVGGMRGEVIEDYGFHAEPVRRGLVTAGVAIGIAFPVFIAVYLGFYEVACQSETFQPLTPPGLCERYLGIAGLHAPPLDLDLLQFAAIQLVVVAMSEELFFRGSRRSGAGEAAASASRSC